MSEPLAISGTITAYRSTPDGGCKITVELDEPQTRRYHEFFHGLGIAVAVARIGESDDDGI